MALNPKFTKTKKPRLGGGFLFYAIVIVGICLIAALFNRPSSKDALVFSEIMEKVDNKQVDTAVFKGTNLELTLKAEKNKLPEVIRKQVSPFWMGKILERFDQAKIRYDYIEPTNFAVISNVIITLLMFASMGFFIWLMYSRQGGDGKNAMSFGRSRARMHDPSKNQVSFQDVAGADEEKAELQEVVDFLKHPKKYEKVGAKIPRGILLVGPPGTGKTLLAKAVAGEAGVPFFSISGSDFVEMFVGVGASRVRDLFEQAKKNAPSIIFIDEIDAVGRQRGAGLGGSHDEREQTLNQLLVEMDGFGPNLEAIVMAATNRPDILDPALLRPGRFDRRVQVSRPDMRGREAILAVHAKNKPIESQVDFKEIARLTPGFTGADLANLLNEAALSAARRSSNTIGYRDISDSVFKVMVGPEKKSHVISDQERRLTAYHEAGHAIILRSCSHTQRVERVTIIPAGGAGGYTAYKPHEDLYFNSVSHLKESIKHALGGRGAEEVILGEVSTGASGDLQMVNQTARAMITNYGMSDKLPNMVFDDGGVDGEVFLGRSYGHSSNYSDETAKIIDDEVKSIINECYQDVLRILRDKIETLHAVANRLMEVERIDGPEFEAIYMATTSEEQRRNDAQNPGRDEVFIAELVDRAPEKEDAIEKSGDDVISLEAATNELDAEIDQEESEASEEN